MIKPNTVAALILSGGFAGGASFAPKGAAKPTHLLAAYASGSSVPRPEDSGAIPVFKITPTGSKIT